MADSSRKSPVVPPEVRELIEESQTIQGWVERLAEHADEARPEVYRRVLSDYEGRLQKVTGRLVKHRADLVSNLEDHQARVASLEKDRDAHSAELEEAGLRHAVGEFADDEWEERRGGIEEAISGIDERLSVEREAVGELTAIISSIGEGGTPAVTERAAAVVPAPADSDQGAAASPAESAGRKTAARDDGEEPEEDAVTVSGEKGASTPEADEPVKPETADAAEEPADEPATAAKSGEGSTPSALGEPGDASEADEQESGGDYLDELEFLESLSLEDAERFDAVSAMLDDDEAGNGKKES